MFDLLQQAVDSAIASGAKYSDARILSSKSRSSKQETEILKILMNLKALELEFVP